jgi:hypothetical protein
LSDVGRPRFRLPTGRTRSAARTRAFRRGASRRPERRRRRPAGPPFPRPATSVEQVEPDARIHRSPPRTAVTPLDVFNPANLSDASRLAGPAGARALLDAARSFPGGPAIQAPAATATVVPDAARNLLARFVSGPRPRESLSQRRDHHHRALITHGCEWRRVALRTGLESDPAKLFRGAPTSTLHWQQRSTSTPGLAATRFSLQKVKVRLLGPRFSCA